MSADAGFETDLVAVSPLGDPAAHLAAGGSPVISARNLFWQDVDTELAGVPAAPQLRHDPFRSTDEYTFYTVRLSSIGRHGSGSYRIAGFLSVPTREGPHPGLLELPRHGSVNHTPHRNERERYVVFTVMHRGQRLADSPYRAQYPGLLTEGITSPVSWVYRGILADCLRAAEFLSGMTGVDTARLAAIGDDLALLTASRRPLFAAIRIDSLLLTDLLARSSATVSYPLEELNDVRRNSPADLAAAQKTLTHFDPLTHAHAVTARTLVSAPGDGTDPAAFELVNALGSNGEIFPVTYADGVDADGRDAWLADALGVKARSRFLTASVPLPGESGAR
jgi:cephalosporin-C deacetylase-like acetyl esterase